MIELKSVTKAFDGRVVLDKVDARFYAGKTNLIIGQSGSGKTVMMKCIVGLLTPESGEVLYDGKNFLQMNKDETKNLRQEIGMLFQNSALFDSLTVLENVMFPLNMLSDMKYKEKLKRVLFCLERVNLKDVGHLYPSDISGGMKKRVAIARAIVLNTKYLFCDEPNSGLDPQTSLVIDKLIREITKEYNITTIINTHDMNSVLENGENIIFIHKGKVEWTGTRTDIITSENEDLNNFIFASELFQKLRAVEKKELSDQ